jgi:DNA-binding XRE family transcriptional regulator
MNFKTYIDRCGRSQADLAQQLGVTKSYISYISSGKRKPSWSLARRILLIAQGQITADELVAEFGDD